MCIRDSCKPTVSYVLNAMDLSVLTGYEHEAWNLGDYVRVEDKELGLSVTTRIVRREYNLQEPWNTVLEPVSYTHLTTDHIIVTDGERFEVTSVEDVKGRGMYTEVLAKKVVATVGKG